MGWMQEDTPANCRLIVGFVKMLIEFGLVASLGLVEGRVDFRNLGLELVNKFNAVFSGRVRCVFVVVMKSQFRMRSGQSKVEEA